MILARLAVLGAVLCTLWFNGSYAWAKAGTDAQKLGMVAVAITIDLCKCGFLPAASRLWREGWKLSPLVLVLLWPLTFAYSSFSGYASITGNRANIAAAADNSLQSRQRAQNDYDEAKAILATARNSALWEATAACTAIKTDKQRSFCTNVATTTQRQDAAANVLNQQQGMPSDPEIHTLADNTGFALPTLNLIVALTPALILELVSSLGFYAVQRRPRTQPPRTRFKGLSKLATRWVAWCKQNASAGPPVATGAPAAALSSPPPPARAEVTEWVMP